jgi:hypothetical protein
MPGAPLRKPVAASASALIAAPPAAVWDVIYAPELSAATHAKAVAAGVVPGTSSVATYTRSPSTIGSPYSCPSSVGDVHALAAVSTEPTPAATPLPGPS